MRWRILLCMGVLAVVATGHFLYMEFLYEPEPAKLSAEEWNICETVFRFELARWTHMEEAYLDVKERGVPRDFVHRFQRAELSVKPGWKFREGRGRIVFRILRIDHLGKGVVEVYGDNYSGTLAAAGFTYRVVRRGGRWVVESANREWVS